MYSLKVSMVRIHAREGLRLHHVFFLERVMVALKRAHALMLDVSISLYLSNLYARVGSKHSVVITPYLPPPPWNKSIEIREICLDFTILQGVANKLFQGLSRLPANDTGIFWNRLWPTFKILEARDRNIEEPLLLLTQFYWNLVIDYRL